MKSVISVCLVIFGLSLWSLLGGGSPPTESPSAPLATSVRAESAKPALNLNVARLERLGIESPERITAMPIQDIRVGMRVPASNPHVDGLDGFEEQVDPATWKKITMICPRADGSETDVTFLRSPGWIRESIRLASGDVIESVDDRLIGRSIEIVISEIALSGMARIVALDDCPAIADGPGEIVTGTFATNRAAVLDLEFSGLPDTLGVTAEHPIWSETRADFVPASQLEIGEEVLALNGQTTKLSSITPRAGPEAVYNFEVANEHVYFVTRDGLLVHNAVYFAKYLENGRLFLQGKNGKILAHTPANIKQANRLRFVPDRANDTLLHVRRTGSAPPGYRGGRRFRNDGRNGGEVLPRIDSNGNAITYREFDITPHFRGVNRGAERIVIGSNGIAYYTFDHYKTFLRIFQ